MDLNTQSSLKEAEQLIGEMNPYTLQLGGQDPVAVIGDTPRRLHSLVEALGPERVGMAPAPGKWSVRQILCHLADWEVAFAFRLRQAVAEARHVIQYLQAIQEADGHWRFVADPPTLTRVDDATVAAVAGLAQPPASMVKSPSTSPRLPSTGRP